MTTNNIYTIIQDQKSEKMSFSESFKGGDDPSESGYLSKFEVSLSPLYTGKNGGFIFFVVTLWPVHSFKPLVTLDIFSAIF